MFSNGILIIEIGAYCFGHLYAIPFIEGVGTLCEKKLSRFTEMAADSSAIEVLNSNEGALDRFNTRIESNLKVRIKDETTFNTDKDEYFNTPYRWTNFIRKLIFSISKDTVVSNASRNGENRNDLGHPTLMQRKENALNYVRKVKID